VLHQVGVSFDLYYDARKHKIKASVLVDRFCITFFARRLSTVSYCYVAICTYRLTIQQNTEEHFRHYEFFSDHLLLFFLSFLNPNISISCSSEETMQYLKTPFIYVRKLISLVPWCFFQPSLIIRICCVLRPLSLSPSIKLTAL